MPPPRRRSAAASLAAAVASAVLLPACTQLEDLPGAADAPTTTTVAPAGPGDVPLRVVSGTEGGTLGLVQVFINDTGPFVFAVDTGASHSVVDLEVATRLGLPVVAESQQEVTGVTGTATARFVRITSWRAATTALPGTRLSVLDLPDTSGPGRFEGLLGSDALSGFGEVTVDYRGGRLLLGSGG